MKIDNFRKTGSIKKKRNVNVSPPPPRQTLPIIYLIVFYQDILLFIILFWAEYLIGSQREQGMYTTRICVRIGQVLH